MNNFNVVIAPQNRTFHNSNYVIYHIRHVVIAPQNWTFHNTNNLNHYQNGVVIAQFKTGPSTTRFARANPQKRCNSPSKSDLPQPVPSWYL